MWRTTGVLLLWGLAACVFAQEAAIDDDAQALAGRILEATGVTGGLVVHWGCGDGELTAALCAGEGYLVHALDRDARNVADARERLQALGLYGRASVARCDGTRLPYVDGIVNLLVAEDPGGLPESEALRVLAPGGVAYVKQAGEWDKAVKPRPHEMDEWTHYLHDASNNAVAHDSIIGPPRRLQWLGSPVWARHHDHMASMSAMVSSGGRLFYIFDEGPTASIELPPSWQLIARDAFNGTVLWKRPIADWHTHLWPLKSGPAQLPRRLVAVGERVYVTLGIDAPLRALDAATGETLWTCETSRATEEIIAVENILVLLVDEAEDRAASSQPDYQSISEISKDARQRMWDAPARVIKAVNAETGEPLWEAPTQVAPLTLASDGERVFFHDGAKIVCLDLKTGERLWASAPLLAWSTIRTWFAPTLVVYEGVVLFSGGETMKPHYGADDTMTAVSAETGETLWSAAHPQSGYQSPEDILVAGGLVWTGVTTQGSYSGVFTGRDPHTGKVKQEFPPDVQTHWFHHRCHRSKATDNYLLTSRTGIEFIDFREEHWEPHHWVRGGCLYGIMPCNGLVYTPPHACACYVEAKQYGLNALAPAADDEEYPRTDPDDMRLERGPAWGQPVTGPAASAEDWPTYRHDPARSGSTPVVPPTDLSIAWQASVGGKITSPVVAGGMVLVASVDTHTVHALDAGTGEALWEFTAGGRVDSPPTVHDGRALFGCADGWVYCLRAGDGALIWRFRAAPQDRRLVAFEQVESVWPVHGSVLVHEGDGSGREMVYCVAGRSMFLDGGLRFLGLDPATGEKLVETVLDDRDPETGQNLQMYVKTLNMTVALPDILSTDGPNIYMRSMAFDLEGGRREIGFTRVTDQAGDNVHLFSPTGFLDDAWWHRSYWIWGQRTASGATGYFQAGRLVPAGRMLVIGEDTIYGFGRKPDYFQWTTPLEYHLFAAEKEIPALDNVRPRTSGSYVAVANSETLDPSGKPLTVEAWVRPVGNTGVVLARGGSSNGYALHLRDGKLCFTVTVDSEQTTAAAPEALPKTWTHVAGTLTADGQVRVYVNGKPAGSAQGPGLITSAPFQPTEIGADDAGAVGEYKSPNMLKATIDEVRIYHRALGPDEVARHCNSPEDTPATDDGLALYFSFDAEDARDDSGGGNEGVVEDGAIPVEGRLGGALRFQGAKKWYANYPYMVEQRWTQDIALQVRAMALTGDRLLIAGPPDVLDEEDAARRLGDPEVQAQLVHQRDALEGKLGGSLWTVSAGDGETLAELPLEAPPIFDGMAVAAGRVYLATTTGEVVCLSGD
jgi:outer membrane protein assembly factor BamB